MVMKKILAFIMAICLVFSVAVTVSAKGYEEYYDKISSPASDSASINVTEYSAKNMKVSKEDNYQGQSKVTVITDTKGEISWKFDIPSDGAYCLKVDYFPIESKNSQIEIGIKIDGKYPFKEAENITLKKLYKNLSDEKKFDNRGNEILSEKTQANLLISDYVRNFLGEFSEPYYFDLEKGSHTLTLVAVTDKLAIAGLEFSVPEEIPEYTEYKNSLSGNKADAEFKKYVQAEDVTYTSSSMMVAVNDRTSPLTVPNDAYNVFYNTFGGQGWSSAGEYGVWIFTVPKDGLYKIGLKFRQKNSNAILPVRKIYIDGKVPYKELENMEFSYNRNWQYTELKGGEETAEFYFEAGKEHTIKIESVLGDFANYFKQVEDIVYELNSCYRSIIMITGAAPDSYRDYQLGVKIPKVIEKMDELKKQLEDVIEVLDKNKVGNSEMVELSTICAQIEEFVKDPDTIPARLESFKTNIGALSDWCVNAKQQSVEFDYFVISGEKAKKERVKSNIFENLIFEFKAYLASFVNDYSNIGNSYDYEDSIVVWIMSGRDQANTLKTIIDSDFMVKNSVEVDLKLVTNTSLLNAMIAGKGPDVALGVANADPVNYALRNAIVDVSKLEGFEETAKQFYPSAIEPFSFNGGVYAMPETQTFPVMFYRKDVMEQLELDIPETWDDVSNCLTELTNVNMEFGLACSNAASTTSSLGMFLYQNGGKFYIDDNKKSGLTDEVALDSFKQLTNLYNSYRLPYAFDALNRFRSGEMPLVITEYSLFNSLCVSAPELNGLWGVALVPGTKKADGSIDHSVVGTCTGTVITSTTKNLDAAWKFVRWWISTSTQASYGIKIEGLLGQAARYATANKEALNELPWSESELESLKEQHQYVKATPETPGSYFTPRHVYNAFRRVISYGDDPRQTLIDYTEYINREITNKRKEFGLS